jgi:hypothetical protein
LVGQLADGGAVSFAAVKSPDVAASAATAAAAAVETNTRVITVPRS